MTDDWAGSRDLHVEVAARGRRRAGLERALRDAIRAGRLHAGERLPSTRALSRDLGVARGTVADAYGQLAAEGYLTTSQGAPTRVASTPAARQGRLAPAARPNEPRFDLRPGLPDVSSFPRRAWLRALRSALATAPDSALGISDPRGRPELRQALATYLGRARGVLADPAAIVVCTGYIQALGLVARALKTTGRPVIAMEDPCLELHRNIVESAGIEVLPLPVDEGGARPEVPDGAGAVVLTPAHQYPLGGTLAPERRTALVRWARETGGVLVEDDYDGEFRYDRQPVGALQGLDPARVVYAGTASKALVPGLRLAWLVLPADLIEPVVDVKRLADYHSAVLDQLVLADLIGSGGFDRHVRRMRNRYRARRDRLLAMLADRAPYGRPLGVAAGLHLVLELPDGAPSEAELVERGARRSVALGSLAAHWHGSGPRREGLVIGYGRPPEHAFGASLAALSDVVAVAEDRQP
jgi:GntR family transcriptional regulator/MocR family aminotransferase